jgi:short-chain Z-isoprenyl diphosphate synthase
VEDLSPTIIGPALRPSRTWLFWVSRWRALALALLMRPIYSVYERRLLRQVFQRAPPHHVGIILDGNRRFARRSGVTDPAEIYVLGAQKLDDVLDWCRELAIDAVTLWVCSTDNLARPADEVSGILRAVEAKLRSLAGDPRIHCRQVRVRAIGRLDLLPPKMLEAIRAAEDSTSAYSALTLTIAVAYGGREEIVDAVRSMLEKAMHAGASLADAILGVTPQAIAEHLYLGAASEPDLIIRTSGEARLSGFLLWQSTYSELHFTDVLWPAFRKIEFLRAVRGFQTRTRRFGL